MLVFVIEAGRRRRGVRQPVDGHVGDDVVLAQGVAEELAAPGAICPAGESASAWAMVWAEPTALSWTAWSTKPCRKLRYCNSSGQALEFGWVPEEGEDLGDVHSEYVLGVDPALQRATIEPASLPWAPYRS